MSLKRHPSTAGLFVEYPLALETDYVTFERCSVHQGMLADVVRVESLRAAIAKVVRPGSIVLEIGVGTGILTFFALQAGAGHVFAIGATSMAEKAREMLAAQGYGERVTIFEDQSFNVTLPRRADILITETLGHIGVDEGILRTAFDAKMRLLSPHAQIIPRRLRIKITPVFVPAFERDVVEFWRSSPYGLHTQALSGVVRNTSYLTTRALLEAPFEPAVLRECIIGEPLSAPIQGESAFVLDSRWTANGMAMWFDTELAEGVWLDAMQTSSWRPVFLPFAAPLQGQRGQNIHLSFNLSDKKIAGQPQCQWLGWLSGG